MQKRQVAIAKSFQGASNQQPSMLCGRRMTVHMDYAIQANNIGRTIYFCTDSCLNAFRADPERFYCAHSNSAPE